MTHKIFHFKINFVFAWKEEQCAYDMRRVPLSTITERHRILRRIKSWNGERGRIVVKALCYKLEGRGFETR
jgi:hypothetical protein